MNLKDVMLVITCPTKYVLCGSIYILFSKIQNNSNGKQSVVIRGIGGSNGITMKGYPEGEFWSYELLYIFTVVAITQMHAYVKTPRMI